MPAMQLAPPETKGEIPVEEEIGEEFRDPLAQEYGGNDAVCRMAVAGLYSQFLIFELAMKRELYQEKESTPVDWKRNYLWLIDAVSLADYTIHRVYPEKFAYHKRVKFVYQSVSNASAVLEKSEDKPYAKESYDASDRVKFSRGWLERAISTLKEWHALLNPDALSNQNIDPKEVNQYRECVSKVAKDCMFGDDFLKGRLEDLENQIKDWLERINVIEKEIQANDTSSEEGVAGIPDADPGQQAEEEFDRELVAEYLQNLLCMSLREYSLAVPSLIYFGSADTELVKDCFEKAHKRHEQANSVMLLLRRAELRRSIYKRQNLIRTFQDEFDALGFSLLFNVARVQGVIEENAKAKELSSAA